MSLTAQRGIARYRVSAG